MQGNDRVEIFLGFLNDDDKWLKKELNIHGKVSFNPADKTPHHIALSPEEKSLAYQYVHCSVQMRHLLHGACAGFEGERIASITVHSVGVIGVKEVFLRNCQRFVAVSPDDLRYAPDTSEILEKLLGVQGVHVMEEQTTRFNNETVYATMTQFSSNEEFLRKIEEVIAQGGHVLLHAYAQATRLFDGHYHTPLVPEHHNWWKWAAVYPKD